MKIGKWKIKVTPYLSIINLDGSEVNEQGALKPLVLLLFFILYLLSRERGSSLSLRLGSLPGYLQRAHQIF